MIKWVNNIFFSILLSWMVYIIADYVLQEVFISYGNNTIELNLVADEEASVQLRYNLTGNEVFEINLKPGNNVVELPIKKDFHINSMYMITDAGTDISLKSFSLLSTLRKVDFDLTEVKEDLKLYSLNLKKTKRIELVNEELKIRFDQNFTILVFKSALLGKVYKNLYPFISSISIALGLLSFLTLISLFLFKRKFLHASLEMNFCVFFLALIFIPMFSQKENNTSENRALAPFPSLKGNIWRFPSNFSKYYNDRFPFKNYLNQTYNYLIYTIFNSSPIPDFIQVGEDGWLFYSKNEVLSVYRGNEHFSEEELETIKNNLERKIEKLDSLGIEFYLMIPPLKHTIYSEKVPAIIKKIEGRLTKREQLLSYLRSNSTVNIIDPYPQLMKLKDSVQVYYKTDSHWNALAAFKVYQTMVHTMFDSTVFKESPMKLNQFNIRKVKSATGDLGKIINLEKLKIREQYEFQPKLEPKASLLKTGASLSNEGNFIAYKATQPDDKPRLLMYRDSFGEYLHPFLSEHFSYSVYIWSRDYDIERIKKEKPDIVVFELMERYIEDLLK